MIYIIGGTFRSGKSTLAKRVAQKFSLPILGTDIIRMVLIPFSEEIGVHYKNLPKENRDKYKQYLKLLVDDLLLQNKSYIIEGDMIDVGTVAKFSKDKVCSVFLGYPEITKKQLLARIRKYEVEGDWTTAKNDDELLKMIIEATKDSKDLKEECNRYHIRFIDVSKKIRATELPLDTLCNDHSLS